MKVIPFFRNNCIFRNFMTSKVLLTFLSHNHEIIYFYYKSTH